jgi:acetyltransferase-like isoleucine patch superfamily enzyme/acyl carrier protein
MTLPDQLTQLVRALHPQNPARNLSGDTRLDDLGIDSLDRIRLAVGIESRFHVEISDAALAAVGCLSDLAALLDESPRPELITALIEDTTSIPAPRRRPAAARAGTFVHPTAELGDGATLGPGSRIWHYAQLAAGVRVGAECTLGKGVYLGAGTRVGDRVKIQNGVNAFGADIHDDVLLCPGVLLVEDPTPRAVTPAGIPQDRGDWVAHPVTVHRGATIGAGAVALPGTQIGAHAMVAAGTVVSRDVPAHALVAGNPHRQVGWVCCCGQRLDGTRCPTCATRYRPLTTTASAAHGM